MRRTVATHIRTRDLWLSRLDMRSDISTDISRGLNAYAHRQADIYYSLAISLINLWSPELKKNKITVDWPSELAEHAARAEAEPERKSGRKKAKPAHMSDSESDTGPLVGGEDANESDGESILLHLVRYTDNEDSEQDVNEGQGDGYQSDC